MKRIDLKNLIPNTLALLRARTPNPGEIWERKAEWPGARSRRWIVISGAKRGAIRYSYLEPVSGRLNLYGDYALSAFVLRCSYYKTPATMDLETGAVSDQTGVLMPPAKPKKLPWKD